jgi:hypothetical protein
MIFFFIKELFTAELAENAEKFEIQKQKRRKEITPNCFLDFLAVLSGLCTLCGENKRPQPSERKLGSLKKFPAPFPSEGLRNMSKSGQVSWLTASYSPRLPG